jgi:cell division septum initiation protein DivIVA
VDLSHQSITGRQFELNRRGYDPDAVNAHLSEIAHAVAEREARIAELESTIDSLQAKVQDANESEEALRLTLKAAAHAKEELLAGARDQAAQMEQEATVKAESIVFEATARANEMTSSAQARATAIDEEAHSRAGEVAQAALAESQLLVERIQGMRESVVAAERALAAIQADTSPQIQHASEALDGALARAKEIAEDPAVLERVAEKSVAAGAADSPTDAMAEHGEPTAPAQPDAVGTAPEQARGVPQEGQSDEAIAQQPAMAEPPADQTQPEPTAEPAHGAASPEAGPEPAAESGEAQVPSEAAEAAPPPSAGPSDAPRPEEAAQFGEAARPGEAAPHLEVVATQSGGEPDESAADISDKVDRLLEELREVT